MASQPTWIKKRLENSGVEGLVAPSLRFLQGWGFSRVHPPGPITQHLNPHPLKITKGGAPALDCIPSVNLYSLREFSFPES